ncbi:hypothetical protein QY890_06145 [Latilactobacillus sakei]
MGGDDGALSMSTEQAVYALGQYDYLLKGKGSIYNFKKVVPEPDPKPKPDPKPLPTQSQVFLAKSQPVNRRHHHLQKLI